jgi:predicted P-loop ATPase
MDKNTILSVISEQQIFLAFLKLSYVPKGNISSPFSKDKKASFKLYANNTFKCNSTGKQGDCFQFVADLKNIDCKSNFHDVLNEIAKEFPAFDFTKPIPEHQKRKNIADPGPDLKTAPNPEINDSHFSFETKEFEKAHLDYFSTGCWNVTQEILKKYNVFALDKFEFYNSKKEEISKLKLFTGILGFAYKLNDSIAEIYIPKQEKATKFFLNKFRAEDIFGLEQLNPKAEFVIICAGKKDCLILNANGFNAVSFRSENHNVTANQIKSLNNKNIFICYDNDEAGVNARKKISAKFDVNDIIIPEEYNDVAEFFTYNDKADFQKLIDKVTASSVDKSKEIYSIFHQTEDFISNKYKFRYNQIKMFVEIAPLNSDVWKELNENNLYLDLQKHGIKISIGNLSAILKSDFCKNFNPIQNYFENLPKWDGQTDHIANLAKYVLAFDATAFEYHFKKWLVRSVFCAMDDAFFNKQALVLVSNQNDGKTSFWNWLSPASLSAYYTDRITTDKDGIISLARNFMINIDELASLNKQDTKQLKALFSMKNINIRVPFGRNEANLLRRCSFVGSTNEQSFLADETGSVRWLCFNIKGINWDYSKHCNVDYVWSQAYALWKSTTNRNQWDLSKEEIENNEKRNAKFKQLSIEQELIGRYFEKAQFGQGKHFTSTDILVYLRPLGVNVNAVAVGRAMHSLGYEKAKDAGVYGYWLHPKPLYEESNFNTLREGSFHKPDSPHIPKIKPIVEPVLQTEIALK